MPNIQKYTQLKTLVLDRNHLKDGLNLPRLPGLQNLWLNDNEVRRPPLPASIPKGAPAASRPLLHLSPSQSGGSGSGGGVRG